MAHNAVESVQSNPNGKLIFDASGGDRFYPNGSKSKLVAAIAFVIASNLNALASSSRLSADLTDAYAIPVQWRGYITGALGRGFITLDRNQYDLASQLSPTRSLTVYELARAANQLVG